MGGSGAPRGGLAGGEAGRRGGRVASALPLDPIPGLGSRPLIPGVGSRCTWGVTWLLFPELSLSVESSGDVFTKVCSDVTVGKGIWLHTPPSQHRPPFPEAGLRLQGDLMLEQDPAPLEVPRGQGQGERPSVWASCASSWLLDLTYM